MDASELKIGQLVTVGGRFVMGDRVGQGRIEADEYTGKTFRVVAIRTSKISGLTSAALAPSNLRGVDESDEIVDIVARRLEPARCMGCGETAKECECVRLARKAEQSAEDRRGEHDSDMGHEGSGGIG